MDYSDFIENYDNENINLFEKTLLVINRANDIYKGKTVTFENEKKYRALDCAIYEVNKKNINPDFSEKITEKENILFEKDSVDDLNLLDINEDENISTVDLEADNEELSSQMKIDYNEDE